MNERSVAKCAGSSQVIKKRYYEDVQRSCMLRSGVSLKPEPIFCGFMNGHDYVTFEDNLDYMAGIKMRNDMYQT